MPGAMSRRRQVLPGDIVAIDRRTTRRCHLFTPDEAGLVEEAFWYCLAYAARKYGVLILAACLMSTHIHLVLQDLHARRPDFYAEFHRLFALRIKAIRGWPEEVFNKSGTHEHELVNNDAILDAVAYLITNPPASGAVRYSRDWPGAKTRPSDLGNRVIVAKRPKAFFEALAAPKKGRAARNGKKRRPSAARREWERKEWPEELSLELGLPESLTHELSPARVRELVKQRVETVEREIHEEAKQQGISFRGERKVLATHHATRAKSYEVFGSLNPRFAAAGHLDDAKKAIEKMRQFNADYDAAFERLRRGERNVVFPAGTWHLRVRVGVRCRPPPAS